MLNFLGWVVAVILICCVEYGTYTIFKEGGERWDRGTRVMYDTFGRTAYGLGVAWIIYACVSGNGGEVEWGKSRNKGDVDKVYFVASSMN